MRITSSVMLWTLSGTMEERLQTAAKAGLQSAELVAEWADWSDDEIVRLRRLTQSLGLTIDALLATPDWTKRPVSMVDPSHRDNFVADVRRAVRIAQKLEVPQIILMSGNAMGGRT